MKLGIKEMDRLKDLLEMKVGTYTSRLSDLAVHCKHPHNLLVVANKVKVKKLEDDKMFRLAIIDEINVIKDTMSDKVKKATHPHDLVEISDELDNLIEDWTY